MVSLSFLSLPVKLTAWRLGILINGGGVRAGCLLIPLRVSRRIVVISRIIFRVIHYVTSCGRTIRRVHGSGRRTVAPGHGAGVAVSGGRHHCRDSGRRRGRRRANGRQVISGYHPRAHRLSARHDRV